MNFCFIFKSNLYVLSANQHKIQSCSEWNNFGSFLAPNLWSRVKYSRQWAKQSVESHWTNKMFRVNSRDERKMGIIWGPKLGIRRLLHALGLCQKLEYLRGKVRRRVGWVGFGCPVVRRRLRNRRIPMLPICTIRNWKINWINYFFFILRIFKKNLCNYFREFILKHELRKLFFVKIEKKTRTFYFYAKIQT